MGESWPGTCSRLPYPSAVMAESRVLANSQARGYVTGDGELSTVTGNIRRVLSCTFVRSQALCLLQISGPVGKGGKGAAYRRAAALRADHARKQEQEPTGWQMSEAGAQDYQK